MLDAKYGSCEVGAVLMMLISCIVSAFGKISGGVWENLLVSLAILELFNVAHFGELQL